MLRLRRDCGGEPWVQRFFHELATCPQSKPDTKASALSQGWYWLLCASVAAHKDLSPVFAGDWHLPITQDTRTALTKIEWRKPDLSVKEVAATVTPAWQD